MSGKRERVGSGPFSARAKPPQRSRVTGPSPRPRRQEILRLVWHDEMPVGAIAERLDLSYGGVSQHLALLRDAGLVRFRRDGKRRLYIADHDWLGPPRPDPRGILGRSVSHGWPNSPKGPIRADGDRNHPSHRGIP